LLSPSLARLRAPAYAILASAILFQFLEILVRAWPFRIHATAWRLGLVAAAIGQTGILLFTLLLAALIAVSIEDRGATLAVAVISWIFAMLFLVGGALFALDVLQFRGQVPGALADQYGVGSSWVAARLAVTIVLLIWLAVAAMAVARGFARQHASASMAGTPLVSATPRTQRVQQ
jgi:hypothetical protein